MPGRRQPLTRRVVHKSTGGMLPSTPQPVDLVGNAARLSNPEALTFLTVAHPTLFLTHNGRGWTCPVLVDTPRSTKSAIRV
jgi:hypothetical protein